MFSGDRSIKNSLQSLDAQVAALRPNSAAIDRWRADAAAALFHLQPPRHHPIIVCILGGTGKSTLVNRLLEANLSAASFRRTFTAGPVAIACELSNIPGEWLGLPHVATSAADLPVHS